MNVRIRLLLVIGLALSPTVLPPTSVVGAFKYLQVGMTSPPVNGQDMLTGEKVSSEPSSGDDREVVCVVFWASWSPRSLELMADLKDLCVRMADHPFRVIAVDVDSQVTTSVVRERVKKILVDLDPPFPVISDDNLEFFYGFGVVAVPSLVLLDAEGIVRAAPSGYSYAARDQLIESVETMLGLRSAGEKVAVERKYRSNPTASRYYFLAVQLTNQRLYEAALSNTDLALKADTSFSAPYSLRGQIRLQLGQTEEALADFKRAIALDSTSVNARAGLGRAILETGNPAAAQEHLEKALALDRSYPVALADLARCLVARREPENAVATLEEAIELNPRDPRLFYHLGLVFRELGQTENALEAYRTALEMLFPRP